jgi:hypothetical protein
MCKDKIIRSVCFAEALLWERKNRLKGYYDEFSFGPESVK